MRFSLVFPTCAFAAGLVLGCGEHPGITDANPDAAPAFKAEVSRFEDHLIIFQGLGGDQPIAALMGVSPERFPAYCTGDEAGELVPWVIVTHPSRQGGTSAHVRIKAKDLSALVWPVDIGPGGDVCDLDVQPFVGTVHVTINDNEGEFFKTAPGANAVVVRFVGTVTDPATGQRYHLQGGLQFVILPDGTEKSPPVLYLKLTPIGG